MNDDQDPDGPVDATRLATRRLADGLRDLLFDVVDRQLSSDDAEALADAVEGLRRRIGPAPRRPRYYEDTLSGPPGASFVDFSPISGRSHPLAVPMIVERVVGEDGAPGVRARLRITSIREGPPRGVHGGVMAAVFDELLGHAQRAHAIRALTATLTVRYRAVTPIDEDLELWAQVVHEKGRRWRGSATCRAGEVLTAEADALFVGVDLSSIASP